MLHECGSLMSMHTIHPIYIQVHVCGYMNVDHSCQYIQYILYTSKASRWHSAALTPAPSSPLTWVSVRLQQGGQVSAGLDGHRPQLAGGEALLAAHLQKLRQGHRQSHQGCHLRSRQAGLGALMGSKESIGGAVMAV